MKVIFDFDDVLFNGKKFKGTMFKVLEDRGYENIEKRYDSWRTSGQPFSLLDFITSLDTSLKDEEKEILYEEILSFSMDCVNKDIFTIMKELGKKHCYIVTNGIPEFQMGKIRRSVGLDSVQEIVVVSGSKANVVKEICERHKNEEIIFVDDKILYLNDIKTEGCENLKTVLFNENGLENLKAEMKESEKREANKKVEQEEFQKRGTVFPSVGMR